jgi:hypothetical protein
MAALIRALRTRRQRLRSEDAAQLRQLVLAYGEEQPEAVARIVAVIDRETAAEREWTFVMISPAQNALVVDQIMQMTVRPALTVRLWAKLFLHLRMDTGEVVATREELAAEVGTQARHVSTAMGELENMGALIRRKEGRRSRWFMNPRVGTHLAGAARDKAQATAPALRLVEPR